MTRDIKYQYRTEEMTDWKEIDPDVHIYDLLIDNGFIHAANMISRMNDGVTLYGLDGTGYRRMAEVANHEVVPLLHYWDLSDGEQIQVSATRWEPQKGIYGRYMGRLYDVGIMTPIENAQLSVDLTGFMRACQHPNLIGKSYVMVGFVNCPDKVALLFAQYVIH